MKRRSIDGLVYVAMDYVIYSSTYIAVLFLLAL